MKFGNKPIVVTNDDGYRDEGIETLKKIANKISSNVWVIAPASNQSAKSHSITINKPIKVRKNKNKEFIVDGTPVDCVMIGLEKIISKTFYPYLLLSGINNGINMGLDSYYSGTISAAREGCLNGIMSIAISIEKNRDKKNWRMVSLYLPKIIENILKLKVSSSSYFNINFPNIKVSKVKGVKYVQSGGRKPGTIIIKKQIKDEEHFTIPSARKMHESAKKNIDEYELNKGFITISIYNLENSENLNRTLLNKDILEQV